MLEKFEEYQITQIPRSANTNVELLARIVSASGVNLNRTIPVEFLPQSIILVKEQEVHPVSAGGN